ncbi:MAG: thiamine-phosphate kinase [Bacteroides sp.]|jgi:thiamine-monophosphate kinase|nr:thiamine-phosphate kinase [Bacteroides sp.]
MSEHEKKALTDISSLGEFRLIDHLTKNIQLKNPGTLKGVGDDAAVLETGQEIMLVSKDLLVEGVHFDIVYTPLKHLGYKAVAVNLSDIYAMNGTPAQVIIGLAVSSRYSLEALEELYEGMLLACEKYGVDMVGGDTTASPSGMVLSVTVIGHAPKEKVVYRGGSAVNDLICVSGSLGGAYCGLLVLKREKAAFKGNPDVQPDLGSYEHVLERQLKPEPRRDIVDMLSKAGVMPSSMIDISDGLASEVMHLCKNSGNGAVIYEEHIPIDQRMAAVAHEFNIDPTTCALSGGEDYELLFTARQEDYEKIKELESIRIIGHMADASQGAHLVTTSGQWIELTAQGWDGLRKRED